MGFGKILDVIGGALNIFDFSFFISGSVTLGILLVDVVVCYGADSINAIFSYPTWLVVILIIMAIYVSGLISWMIGRNIRRPHEYETLPNDCVKLENGEGGNQDDFSKEYDRIIKSVGIDNDETIKAIKDRNDAYSYMWIKLESKHDNTGVKSHLDYCKRLWVMRALFEGLIFSWIFAIIVMLDIVIFHNDSLRINLAVICLLFLFFIIMTYLSNVVASSYARNQLKDTIIAYKIYVLNS